MGTEDLKKIAERFAVPGRAARVTPLGCGNVNDTYLAVFRTAAAEQKFVLQRINTSVFRRPAWLMSNLRAITEHVQRRIAREAPRADRVWQIARIIPAKNGRSGVRGRDGSYWRALTLISKASSYEKARGLEHAREAGTVLGQFHRLVSDLSPAKLRDTLPGFHQTPLYLKRYDQTRRSAPAARRIKASAEARRLAAFIEERRDFAGVLEDARRRGELSPRIIHGDPKVSNIMIDDLTGKGTSLVDLDTAKPGLIHYDFGDSLRSICNPAGEETKRLSEVRFDVRLCEAFTKGYMSRARDFLTTADRKYLYASIRLITFELGLRFFEDHLAGNTYFKTSSPGHNLRRARVQFRLCERVEADERKIRAILEAAR